MSWAAFASGAPLVEIVSDWTCTVSRQVVALKLRMGCVSAKERSPREESESPKHDKAPSTRSSGRRSNASAKVETADIPNGVVEKDKERAKVKAKQNGTVTTATAAEEIAERRREREREKYAQAEPNPRLSNPPKNIEGEQVAAGWPQWLSQVAGEAIKGWIPRRADSFEKLDKVSFESCLFLLLS